MKVQVTALSLVAFFSVASVAVAGRLVPDKPPAAEPVAQVASVPEKPKPVAVGNKVCPVCGMHIPAKSMGTITAEYKGKLYNVCSAEDKAQFDVVPDFYAKKAEEELAGKVADPKPTTRPAARKR